MRITDFNLSRFCHKMSNTLEVRIGKMRNSTERCRKCECYFPRETRATSAAFPIFAFAQKYDIWGKLAKVQGITTLFRVLCKSRCKALSLRTKVVRDSNTGANQNLKENRNTPWIVERGKKGELKKKNNGPRTNGTAKRRAARRNSRAHCSSQPAFCLSAGRKWRRVEKPAFLSRSDLAPRLRRSSDPYFRQN